MLVVFDIGEGYNTTVQGLGFRYNMLGVFDIRGTGVFNLRGRGLLELKPLCSHAPSRALFGSRFCIRVGPPHPGTVVQ